MKPKTARRILKKRAWEKAELRSGSVRGKQWLLRLEAKCRRIVAYYNDDMDRHFGGRAA